MIPEALVKRTRTNPPLVFEIESGILSTASYVTRLCPTSVLVLAGTQLQRTYYLPGSQTRALNQKPIIVV